MLQKIKKIAIILMTCCFIFGGMALFTACEDIDMSFENRCHTTEDGFVYYVDSNIGLCIIGLPDNEEVIIPEFIDNKLVKQLGYKEVSVGVMKTHTVNGSKVKKLTIQHTMDYYSVLFPNVETLVYVDVLYCFNYGSHTSLTIKNALFGPSNYASVKLQNLNKIVLSTRNTSGYSNPRITLITIPEIVTEIAEGTFSNSNIKIATTYFSKPDGWADGWNGDCEVEWGAEL